MMFNLCLFSSMIMVMLLTEFVSNGNNIYILMFRMLVNEEKAKQLEEEKKALCDHTEELQDYIKVRVIYMPKMFSLINKNYVDTAIRLTSAVVIRFFMSIVIVVKYECYYSFSGPYCAERNYRGRTEGKDLPVLSHYFFLLLSGIQSSFTECCK